MNFEFSPEQRQLKEQARRFFEKECSSAAVRAILDGPEFYDRALWQGIAGQGYLGINIPEDYGGLGLGYLDLCVVAEEIGRVLAPVPFSSSVYLATEFLLAAGTKAQKSRWLPHLAAGGVIGTFAFAEAPGPVTSRTVDTRVVGGKLTGTKLPVPDGDIADFAIVAAQEPEGLSLFLTELNTPDVSRSTVSTIDPSRGHARVEFKGNICERIGVAGAAAAIIEGVTDVAAVLFAFEQIGGADKSLEMARNYALERIAFGRQIGSFQAIKHMLADMYVSTTLARSNGYYAAWALSTRAAELPEAAASARVSATLAQQHCAKSNIQIHGGMGFTWASDCHLHYRRSHLLGLSLGGLSQWEDILIKRLCLRNAA